MRTEELENTSRVNLSSNSLFSRRGGTKAGGALDHRFLIIASIVNQKLEAGREVARKTSTMVTGAVKVRLEAGDTAEANGGALVLAQVDPIGGKSSIVAEILSCVTLPEIETRNANNLSEYLIKLLL